MTYCVVCHVECCLNAYQHEWEFRYSGSSVTAAKATGLYGVIQPIPPQLAQAQ